MLRFTGTCKPKIALVQEHWGQAGTGWGRIYDIMRTGTCKPRLAQIQTYCGGSVGGPVHSCQFFSSLFLSLCSAQLAYYQLFSVFFRSSACCQFISALRSAHLTSSQLFSALLTSTQFFPSQQLPVHSLLLLMVSIFHCFCISRAYL